MNIFETLIDFFKNLFNKKENVKELSDLKENLNFDNDTDISKNKGNTSFLNNIKVNLESNNVNFSKNKSKSKSIKTPVSPGDGLGIQKKVNY